MNKAKYLSIAIVSVILGVMLVLQFRSTAANQSAGVPYDRAQELTVQIRQLEKEKEVLQQEANDLSYKLNQAQKGQAQALKALNSELHKVMLFAGMLPVEGPGVEVVLDNLPQPERQGVDVSLFSVRDDDLLKVINELRGVGAEAMSINEIRVVATSEIRLAGSFINVNLTRVLPPYRIKAVGDPNTLKSSLEMSGGPVEYLKGMDIQVLVEKKEHITLPAYSGRQHFNYTKPAKKRV